MTSTDIEDARRLVEQEKQARIEKCQEGITALLRECRCTMGAQISVTPDGRLVAVPVLMNQEQ